jgi:esterase/lipase superfamily enzyme
MTSFRVGTAEVPGTKLYATDVSKLGDKVKISIASEKLEADDARKAKVGSDGVFAAIREEMLEGADALLMIHGYNYTFRDAMARAAQLKQWLETERPAEVRKRGLVMMAFSWPSLGEGVTRKLYELESERARASGVALGRAMLKATDFLRAIKRDERCTGSVNLLAHSMGNWALRGAVQAMKTFVGNNIPPIFNEVILAAADEDHDTLLKSHKIAPLLGGCRRVTVYHNAQDAALKASDTAMGNPDRLGRSGPAPMDPWPAKVAPVNVAPAVLWDVQGNDRWQEDDTGHQYYRNNPVVRQDMQRVLASLADGDIKDRKAIEGGWRLDRKPVPAAKKKAAAKKASG